MDVILEHCLLDVLRQRVGRGGYTEGRGGGTQGVGGCTGGGWRAEG